MSTAPRMLFTVVVVAAIGFAWAHFGLPRSAASPRPLDRQAAVANFKVDYPSSWHLTPARPVSRFPLSDEVELRSAEGASGTLTIGTAHPPDPSLLPERLRAVLSPEPQPQVVRLGALNYLRFLNLAPRGRPVSESVYVLPTTLGTITGVCVSASPSVPFTSGCERVLGSIQVTTGAPLSLGVDTGYALALNQILNQLNAERRADGPGLQAGDIPTRIRAATALARAHSQAASAVGQISTAGTSVANPAVVSALQLDAAAYHDLARAAAHQDALAYGRAQSTLVIAGRTLNSAFAQLRRVGYRIG
ncbi:MAG: hypothetical protein WBQ18_04755 [Solirubrobacteraceae bacterium]